MSSGVSRLASAALLALVACHPGEPGTAQAVLRYQTSHPALDALQARFQPTLEANRKAFSGRTGPVAGFGAGAHYPQIWLRDSATLLPATRFLYDRELLASWLEEHLAHQQRTGALFDWVAAGPPDAFEWAPRAAVVFRDGDRVLCADTNTVEADQEASAVIAAGGVFDALGDPAWLQRPVAGVALLDRLDMALQHVTTARRDPGSGLVVNALTADWGDVSPSHGDQRAIYLDEETPRVVGIYTNAMVFHAARELARLHRAAGSPARAEHWEQAAAAIREAAQTRLWDEVRGFFRIHAPAGGGAAPDFDDSGLFAMGGNGLAALHGLATDEQAGRLFAAAEARRLEHGFSTVSAALLPAYPTGFFRHPILHEAYTYQNGGQWDWFGGRFVLAEFQRGDARAALEHLLQIARRVASHEGLHEWYTRDDQPRGSASYAGSAGALAGAVIEGLFGIELGAASARLRVRLGEEAGEVEVSEPASGRRLSYAYRPVSGALELELRGDVVLESVGVALPLGREVGEVRVDGARVAHRVETVGRDRYAVFTPGESARRVVISTRPRGPGVR